MTRTVLAALALASLIGCKGFDRQRDQSGRPDLPGLTIEEQQARGRARYANHEDDFRVGPRTFTDRPTPTGVGR
jgi:hypothetical protein